MSKINNKECCVITFCPFCNTIHEVYVNELDYLDYKDGMTAQEAFPYLSAEDREKLVSGMCPDCWKRLFPSQDE